MSKKEQTQAPATTPTTTPDASPSGNGNGTGKGKHTITAPTRDDLFTQVEQMQATLTDGQTLSSGAVGRKADGTYILEIEIN